ncbi:MAG TPA: GNAT family protein [Candidatus Dormibacteraeota bacterium]
MAERITLEGNLVRLEPLTLEHAGALLAAAAEQPELYRWTWVPRDIEGARAYIEEALGPAFVAFATVRLEDQRVVGSTRFRLETWAWPAWHLEHGRTTPDVVEIGWTWLAASALRSGINTEAKKLMLRHAFETWHVHAVRLTTDYRNERSRAAIERIGAKLDGVIRAARNAADGTVRDSAFYSITAAEWPAVDARLEQLLTR